MPYALVILVTKWCGGTGMAYKWDVGVHLTEHDQLWSTLLSRVAHEGCGYKCFSDLRSPQWLASNSLCFDAELSEYLIQWWKVSGHNQVFMVVSLSVKMRLNPLNLGVNASVYFNLIKSKCG